jgi:arsenite-transporting ATPase
VTGAADAVSTVPRSIIRQLMTPNRLRRRVTSVNMILFMGGPQLGELEAGLVANWKGAPFSVITGGIGTLIPTSLVAVAVPALRHYRRHGETPLGEMGKERAIGESGSAAGARELGETAIRFRKPVMVTRPGLAGVFDGWAGPSTRAGARSGSTRYVFVGGKGGSGKTTCAAAAAVALAERGRRLLAISTDPAHSLGDILRRKLTARPSKVPVRRGHLDACELDADRTLQRWLAARRPALAAIFQRGTILDRDDVESFLNMSLPGVDEVFGLLEIERLAARDAYDCVVIDTAPTGHTLRLLATPDLFRTFARVLDLMQEKHRVLAAAFGRQPSDDGSEALIEELSSEGDRLGALLRDSARTRLCWVMLPEEMSVAESTRAVTALRTEGIRVNDIVVNRLTPPPQSPCALCDGRRRVEAEWLQAIATQWDAHDNRWTLAACDEPPRGVDALRAVARSVVPMKKPATPRSARRPIRLASLAQGEPDHAEAAALPRQTLPAPIRPPRSTRLLIVGGKGGVGKTTCAATLAMAVARQTPDRRILLVSTDPAHSIGDVIGQKIGPVECRIREGPGNLLAREIDAAQDWRERRAQYRESVARLLETGGAAGADLAVDRAIIEQLFELAPPGMDEIIGILTIIDALLPGQKTVAEADGTRTDRRFDLVIVDSAPTGHTLRLLALPAQAHAWVKQLMAVVLKYKAVAALEQLAGELIWLSRGLRRLQDLLVSPRQCGFVVVTRPEQLPTLETIRLIDWLARHRIARRALIVNGITPPGCPRCRRTAARERREIAAFTRASIWNGARCPIIVTDAIARPPRGVASLAEWQRTWRTYDRSPSTAR